MIKLGILFYVEIRVKISSSIKWAVNYKKYVIAGLFDEVRSGRPREVTDEIKQETEKIAESSIYT